jgi:hypothetical protein
MVRKPLCIQYRRVLAVRRAAPLREFVLVVREDQVVAAAVDVDGQPEHRLDHGRALDVPAGRPGPKGLSQTGSPGLDGFHSTKSAGCACTGDLDPSAGDHVLQPRPTAAVVGEGLGVEQHVPSAA